MHCLGSQSNIYTAPCSVPHPVIWGKDEGARRTVGQIKRDNLPVTNTGKTDSTLGNIT